ncbi:ABC transporter ATP-binding protein [Tepidiforma sp.]|uniref:ABC transporter ATP-binding protein n=1 Tax=Tepidiforma sp. TaxID=2682230 RepID=UPI002ADD4F16|nr:ABC transporter ATP-binding protein [Tepidiforma sp.]
MSGGATVELRSVSRRFRAGGEEIWAVREVSLKVAPGEFLALVGRSGSGKTTLLNLVAGLDRPTSGEVLIDGQRVDCMADRELDALRRHTVGFIFQSFGLLPLLSARENVELPLRIAGLGYRERRKRVEEALAFVGLGKRAEHRPYELSGGEQQRVAIARALAARPRLILADEPTGELDSATASAVFGLLRDLARVEGITIIACTHDRLVMELAGRVEELADGRLVTTGRRVVLERTLGRDRSPFVAARSAPPGEAPAASGLSSLIGADYAQFRRPGLGGGTVAEGEGTGESDRAGEEGQGS